MMACRCGVHPPAEVLPEFCVQQAVAGGLPGRNDDVVQLVGFLRLSRELAVRKATCTHHALKYTYSFVEVIQRRSELFFQAWT
jgi:hypothetical protein